MLQSGAQAHRRYIGDRLTDSLRLTIETTGPLTRGHCRTLDHRLRDVTSLTFASSLAQKHFSQAHCQRILIRRPQSTCMHGAIPGSHSRPFSKRPLAPLLPPSFWPLKASKSPVPKHHCVFHIFHLLAPANRFVDRPRLSVRNVLP